MTHTDIIKISKELLANGGREGEAARTLRMEPRKVRAFLERFSEPHLQAALRLFLDTDGRLKGGSGSRPRMVLERLLLKLCEDIATPQGEPPKRPPASPEQVPGRVVSNVRTISSRSQTAR